MRIVGSFNTENYQPIQVVYNNTNEGQVVVVLTGSFFPFMSGTIEDISYESAAAYVTSEMTSQFAFSTHFEMGYDYPGNYFWVSCSVGSLAFSTEAERFFGLDDVSSGATIYVTSSREPYFIFQAKETCYTKYSDVFEDVSPQRQSVADDGRVFAISSDDNANFNYLKFTLTNEDKWHVFKYASSSLVPYTWQSHVEEMRSFRPWVVFSNLTSSGVGYENREATLKFKGDNSNFKPQKMFQDVYAYWNCPVFAKLLSTGSNSEPIADTTPQPISFDLAYYVFDAEGSNGFSDDTYYTEWANEGYGFASASIVNGNPFFVGTDSVGKYVSVASSSAQLSTRTAVATEDWTIVCVAETKTMAGRLLLDFQSPRLIPIYCNGRWSSFDSTSRLWGTATINEPVSWITTVDSATAEYNGYNAGSLSAFSPQPYTARTIDSGDGAARLFSSYLSSGFYVGKVYFFALYPWKFSDVERAQMDEYLAYRFPTVYV